MYHGLVTLAASGTQVRPGHQQCKSLGLALTPWYMYGSAVGRYSTLKYFTDYDALKRLLKYTSGVSMTRFRGLLDHKGYGLTMV